jgi:GntR family transcriptional regulator of vanillate catabolism
LDRCNFVPFVSPAHVAFGRRSEEERRCILDFVHRQHHSIVDAIASGDAARAEALCREHAHNQEVSITGGGEH